MKSKSILISAALATALYIPVAATAQQVTLMTGPQGGVWVPLGGSRKGMWEKVIPGLSVQMQPGAGIANVRGIDEGKAHIGFANTITTVDGLAGRPPYPQKVTKVCQVANLYPQYYQMVVPVDSKINSVADLKGKALVTQPKGNSSEIINVHMLQVHGMSYQSLSKVNFLASYTDAVSLMKDGHAQVFTLGTTVPASSVMDLASARDIKLLGVDARILTEMKKINPGYSKLTIKAGTYPKMDKDVDVIGYATHIIAACDLPEDMIYKMVKAMADNVADMAASNKSISGLTPKIMAEDVGIPLHKGAAKFYKEAGAI
ncbi:MAG: TAXI family TRAP transporter solute-binding subunit [Proteobacteria bacterium]|nr:TAXI family TRAP transporter solute-binding subunit [Pseudomonadota bacterium]